MDNSQTDRQLPTQRLEPTQPPGRPNPNPAQNNRDISGLLTAPHTLLTRRLSLGFMGLFLFAIAVQYWLVNRSLWHDEANLAINIVNRSYGELLEPLQFNQAAPPLFLWWSRLAVQLAGGGERVLRFISFGAGIAAPFLMYRLARRYCGAWAALLAIALFCTSRYGLYFSTEFKPYMLDLLLGLGLFQLLAPLRQGPLSRGKAWLLGLAGAVMIWFSYPIIFIMAAVEAVGALETSPRRWLSRLLNRLPMYGLWLGSFGGLYWLSISQTLTNDDLVGSWSSRYPDSVLDVVWGLDAFSRFFYRPMGYAGVPGVMAMLLFVAGAVSFYRRDRRAFWLLNAPMLVTLLASYLQQYPFRERLLLFLMPYAFLMIGEGAIWLLAQLKSRRWVGLLGIALAGSLMLSSTARMTQDLANPTERLSRHHIRPLVQTMQQDWQPGDRLYVYSTAVQAFRFYGPQFGFAPSTYALGKQRLPKKITSEALAELPLIPSELEPQLKGRLWLLLSSRDEDVSDRLIEALDERGTQLEHLNEPSAMLALYEF